MRADDIINGYFGSFNIYTYIYVVALPTELLRQVIKYSSVGSAAAFLGQITFFEGRRPSEKRANFRVLNGTLQLFFGSSCMERL